MDVRCFGGKQPTDRLTILAIKSDKNEITKMTQMRTDWTRAEIAALFDLPFTELLFQAASVHREYHPPTPIGHD